MHDIDSHKLMYHPDRVSDWLRNFEIDPIYIEVSPSGACNHRCTFCALDYVGYKPKFLDYKDLFMYLQKVKPKAVMFGGEGEPFIHPKFDELVSACAVNNIDTAITSNGAVATPQKMVGVLNVVKWIKISVDAGTPETYSKVHGTKISDWTNLWLNIDYMVKETKSTNLGVQLTLLEDNHSEVNSFLRIARDSGVSYAVIKLYSQHGMSTNQQKELTPTILDMENWRKWSTKGFNVIVRTDKPQTYDKCRSLPFWQYIQADGTIWNCSAHLGKPDFCIGHINDDEKDLRIKRDKVNKYMDTFNISVCRHNCRMNVCNAYLHRLVNPLEHDNFI